MGKHFPQVPRVIKQGIDKNLPRDRRSKLAQQRARMSLQEQCQKMVCQSL